MITKEQAGAKYRAQGCSYPQSYHAATAYLVHFGAHADSSQNGRNLIAIALRDLRRAFGHDMARFERMSMLYISGMFPIKR